jgi:cation transport ATPase
MHFLWFHWSTNRWDTDEKWLLYKSNLCFPEHADHTKLLEKYKLKYYNQNVEKYEPPQQEQPSYTQTTSSSSQSSQQQHQSTSTTSTEQRQTFTQGQQASTSVLRALFSRVGISFTLNLMVLLFSLGGIFPLFRFAHASYRFALISAIFNYAYGFYRIHGVSVMHLVLTFIVELDSHSKYDEWCKWTILVDYIGIFGI